MIASNQWMNRPADQRFESLADLQAAVHARRLRSRSADVDVVRVEAALTDGRLVLNSQIEPSEPTHWSFGQLAASVGAPGAYLRTLSPELTVENLNYGLRHNASRSTAKFMTVARDADSEPNVLQAVTSTTYGRIWDADCVEAVQRIVDRSGGKFHNPKAYDIGTGAPKPSGLYASDHDVFMFLIDGGSILDAGPRAQLNRGFIAWNSEVGARTFGLMTFLFNVVCGNHIIWGIQDVNKLLIRHSKGGPTLFEVEAIPTLTSYVEASAATEIATIRKAQEFLLPDEREKLEVVIAPARFTRSELTAAIDTAKKEEGECRTLWQVIQGATAYARGFDYIDTRIDLERRASSLLSLVRN
jgi:hypothetical protein